jgi:hypothetical protein
MAASLPKTITASELSELTGLTDRRHRQLAAEGFFPAPDNGKYQTKPTVSGIYRYLRDTLHKKEDNLAAERKKLTLARRVKLEFETALLQQKYIRREDIGPLLRNLAAHQRAALQNKLENELSVKLAGQDPIEIRLRMADAVDDICRMFQASTKEWMLVPPQDKPEQVQRHD